MKNNIFLILLLVIVGSSSLNAQNDTDYKPLLELGKKWTHGVQAMKSTPDVHYEEAYIVNTVMEQNNLFYYIDDMTGKYFLREDTITQKVYIRERLDEPEEILYDFSLEVGDIFNNKLYVDSIKNEEYFGVVRRVFYMHKLADVSWIVVWVEGIGALSGLSAHSYGYEPEYFGIIHLGFGMTCCSINDSLIYQNPFAISYGCRGEILPPDLEYIGFSYDTLHVASSQVAIIIFRGHTYVDLELTFTSPSGKTYNLTEFDHEFMFEGPFGGDYSIYQGNFNDFNGETGNWRVSHYKAETSAGGILESDYAFKFYVTDRIDIPEVSHNAINIYPNPASDIINIEFDNSKNEELTLQIYNILGENIYSEITTASICEIQLNDYPKGIYICKLIKNNKIIFSKSFIKQ